MKYQYFKEILNSIKEVWNKKILLVPQAYILLFTIIYSTIYSLWIVPIEYEEVLGTPAATNYPLLIISGLIFALIITFFSAINLSSFRQNLEKKKVTAKTQIDGGIQIYVKVVLISLMKFLIASIPIILISVILLMIAPKSQAAATITATLIIIYLLYLMIALIFSDIFITKKNAKVMKSIKDSFVAFNKNKGFVISIVLSMSLVALIYYFTIILLLSLIGLINPLFFFVGAGSIILNILFIILAIPMAATATHYYFKAEKHLKK